MTILKITTSAKPKRMPPVAPPRNLSANLWSTEVMSEKGNDRDSDGNPTSGVVVQSKPKTRKPSMYKVIMLNDDYTPMEFVVMVLERVFNKSHEEAVKIITLGVADRLEQPQIEWVEADHKNVLFSHLHLCQPCASGRWCQGS